MQINRRGIKLNDYGIFRNKYNELKYFCMQYSEKKREAMSGSCLRNADIKQIEQAAMESDMNIYPYILRNLTEGIPYEYMDVPCGRRQFYEARRAFFILLASKR